MQPSEECRFKKQNKTKHPMEPNFSVNFLDLILVTKNSESNEPGGLLITRLCFKNSLFYKRRSVRLLLLYIKYKILYFRQVASIYLGWFLVFLYSGVELSRHPGEIQYKSKFGN